MYKQTHTLRCANGAEVGEGNPLCPVGDQCFFSTGSVVPGWANALGELFFFQHVSSHRTLTG